MPVLFSAVTDTLSARTFLPPSVRSRLSIAAIAVSRTTSLSATLPDTAALQVLSLLPVGALLLALATEVFAEVVPDCPVVAVPDPVDGGEDVAGGWVETEA